MGETFMAAITAWAKASGRPWWGHSGALQNTAFSLFPGPSSSPTGPRPGELDGLGESLGSASYLTMSGSTLHQQMNESPHQRLLLDSWLLVGGARFSADQWLSKTHCQVTGRGVMAHREGSALLQTGSLSFWLSQNSKSWAQSPTHGK